MSMAFFNSATQPQYVSPSVRTSEAFTNGGTNHNFVLTTAPLTNSRLILSFGGRNTSGSVATSVTQTGVTWNRIATSYAEQADSGFETWISDRITGSPSTTVDVVYSNSNAHTAQYAEIRYLSKTPTLANIISGVTTNTGSGTGLTTGSASITATRKSFLLAGFSIRNASATATVFTFPDTNYATVNNISSGSGTANIRSAQTGRIITASQNGSHGTGITADQSAGWAANIVGFHSLNNRQFVSSNINIVQVANNAVQNATTSIAATFGGVPTAGNTLVAFVMRSAGGAISGITQTGATWTGPEVTATNGANRVEMWYAQNQSPSSATVTAGLPVSGSTCIFVMELSGAVPAGDPTLDTNTNTGSGTSVTTASVTGAQKGFAIAGLQIATGTNTFSNPTNGYSILSQTNTGGGGAHCAGAILVYNQYEIGSTSTGATAATSSNWSSAIALMKDNT